MPGFETLASGATRLFLELSKPVAYDAKQGHANITYVLKGAHVERRNNQNPLLTQHFNTPVTSARLVPHGQDLWFVVDVRASVQPSATLSPTKDGAAMLSVEFPKGDYLPPETHKLAPAAPAPEGDEETEAAAPSKPAASASR